MKFNDTYPIDLQRLLETKLLIQAQSGGGKSHSLRLLLEQTAPHVQQLVIDPEGEFATLREKFDFVIAAPHDADAIASPQTAALLARRLHEAGVSAVLDIYDLKAHDRQLFVKRFIDALMTIPRPQWHPVMVVVDEAQIFCPQTGSAEAAASVIDIATRGRKRGLCLVAATLRLSKLHKDCAAELQNKLIGRTGLDLDVKRAAEELGMTPREAMTALRDLEPGDFYAFGPALSRGVEKITIGPVATTHPKSGERLMQAPPAPSKRVLEQLGKLADLQKEAEHEARTVEELNELAMDLRRRLAVAERRVLAAGISEKEVAHRIRVAVDDEVRKKNTSAAATNTGLSTELRKALEQMAALAAEALSDVSATAVPAIASKSRMQSAARAPAVPCAITEGLSSSQQRILDVLASLEMFGIDAPHKSMLAAHAGCSPTSGGYFNNLGKLRSACLINYPSAGTAALTDAGKQKANYPAKAPTLADLHASWLALVSGSQSAILEVLIAEYPNPLAKNELADRVGASRTSGGYFNNLGKLRTLGAIEYPSKGAARASNLLFPAERK